MLNKLYCFDYIIVGAGIIGLSIARELIRQQPKATIAILEKENEIGLHASGRNSGVLHSGIYYKEGSLKAKFCLDGAREMAAYCYENNLPINRIGKLIVSQKPTDNKIIDLLYNRALNNGAKVEKIKQCELKKIEPYVNSATEDILFSPDTSVINPKIILLHIYHELINKNVTFFFNSQFTGIDLKKRKLVVGKASISYGHLFNAAGLYADRVAVLCGVEDRYVMIPFKGVYYEQVPNSSIQINHLIYPVPDMNVPFLGVHFTKSLEGKLYVGPSAIPVLGRENYSRMKGVNIKDAIDTFYEVSQQYLANKQGFRYYAHQEIPRFIKACFVASARALVPNIKASDLVKSSKVGIRAQLLDKHKRELVMDFIVSKSENETHVLNAVSPAFTSAFSFSKFIVNSFSSNL